MAAGGMSGKGILPIGLKCVREIRAVTDCPIIGCGGVSGADDVRAYFDAGATVVGVGSALTGLTTDDIGAYFQTLGNDLATGRNRAESHIHYHIDMSFHPVTLVANKRVCADIALLTFDRKINVQAGEFVFLWLPGLGEKPFSALTDYLFTLAVSIWALYPRPDGPAARHRGLCARPARHTRGATRGRKIMAVAGGTGLAAVYQIARDFGNAEVFAGARSAERLYYLDECRRVAEVHVATDDGSAGYDGVVTELLRERLQAMSTHEREQLSFTTAVRSPWSMLPSRCSASSAAPNRSSAPSITSPSAASASAAPARLPTAAACAWTGRFCKRCDIHSL